MSKNKLTWYDVSLEQFELMQNILKNEDELDKVIALAELLFGEQVTELTVPQFNEYVRSMAFLKTEIPHPVPPKKIELSGRKYFIDCLLGNITTAQYVDFQNYLKTDDTARILSCFVIPEGHKYNDGYDMEEVVKDIKTMPIPAAMSIAFFFGRQFSKFMRTFQSYSVKKIRDLNLPREAKENMEKAIRLSTDLALSPLS